MPRIEVIFLIESTPTAGPALESRVWLEQSAGRPALAMGNERFYFQDAQQMRLLAAAILRAAEE